MNKDYFIILDVSIDSSQEQIKTAFFKKALQYHPDKIDKNNKTEKEYEELRKIYTKKYIDIQQAYKVLSNPEKLNEYKNSINNTFIDLKNNSTSIIIDVPIKHKLGETLSEAFDREIKAKNPEFFKNQRPINNSSITTSYLEKVEKDRDEVKVTKIFSDFDSNEFNNIFEKYKAKNTEKEGGENIGDLVPYEDSNIFDYKNSLVEISNTGQFLSNYTNLLDDKLYSENGFVINEDIIKEIKEDINSKEFKKIRKNEGSISNVEILDKISKYYETGEQLMKTSDFIITKTEVELNHPSLFYTKDDNIEQICGEAEK